MKIINMVCPNCGASLQVDADKKNLTCNYCGSNLLLDDGVQHIVVHKEHLQMLRSQMVSGMTAVMGAAFFFSGTALRYRCFF